MGEPLGFRAPGFGVPQFRQRRRPALGRRLLDLDEPAALPPVPEFGQAAAPVAAGFPSFGQSFQPEPLGLSPKQAISQASAAVEAPARGPNFGQRLLAALRDLAISGQAFQFERGEDVPGALQFGQAALAGFGGIARVRAERADLERERQVAETEAEYERGQRKFEVSQRPLRSRLLTSQVAAAEDVAATRTRRQEATAAAAARLRADPRYAEFRDLPDDELVRAAMQASLATRRQREISRFPRPSTASPLAGLNTAIDDATAEINDAQEELRRAQQDIGLGLSSQFYTAEQQAAIQPYLDALQEAQEYRDGLVQERNRQGGFPRGPAAGRRGAGAPAPGGEREPLDEEELTIVQDAIRGMEPAAQDAYLRRPEFGYTEQEIQQIKAAPPRR